MNYEEALIYFQELQQYGSVPGLESILTLLARLGNPQLAHPVIQIAGTNGKGSVGAFLSSILSQSGITYCRFYSPAVFDVRETISQNGCMISKEEYAKYMQLVSREAEAMAAEGLPHPTVFEVETALFYLWASKQSCALCLVEVGMGGALDATNVVRENLLSVITSISMDHAGFLGDSLDKIAAQKAGIIKPGGVLVTAPQKREVQAVLKTVCEKQKAQRIVAEEGQYADLLKPEASDGEEAKAAPLGLKGSFQEQNAAIAIAAVRYLQQCGYPVTEETIRSGLQGASWPGRFEKVRSHPDVWLDGAHNPDGARALLQAYRQQYGDKKAHVILGILKDKDAAAICKVLAPIMKTVYTITPPGPRGLPARELAAIVSSHCSHVTICNAVSEAVKQAIGAARKDPEGGEHTDEQAGIVLACGSLSYLGQARRCMLEEL